MLNGIIFDMDGVIIDSHPIHKKVWKRFLAVVGKRVSDAELEFVLDGRKKEDILRHFLGDLNAVEIAEYGRRKEELFREEALELTIIEGLPEFLRELQLDGIAMALASSGSRHRVSYTLERLGLNGYFQAVVTGDDVPLGKPDPAIFRRAAQLLNRDCAELVVVEDAVSGVRAANAAGMKCIAIASNGRREALRQAGADCVLENFVGISVSFVQNLGAASQQRGNVVPVRRS